MNNDLIIEFNNAILSNKKLFIKPELNSNYNAIIKEKYFILKKKKSPSFMIIGNTCGGLRAHYLYKDDQEKIWEIQKGFNNTYAYPIIENFDNN